MKKILQILGGIGVVLVIVFAGGVGQIVGKSTTERFFDGKNESQLNSVLMHAASELNKNLPMMVDSETRLDSTVGINKQFRYNYTMINFLESEIDVPAFKEAMSPYVRNGVCTTEEMKVFVTNDVPVTYAYFDKDGKQFAIITIQPTECASS